MTPQQILIRDETSGKEYRSDSQKELADLWREHYIVRQ